MAWSSQSPAFASKKHQNTGLVRERLNDGVGCHLKRSHGSGRTDAVPASRLYVGECANAAGTSHILAAYQTAQAMMNNDMTHTQTGIADRASARRGSKGSSVLKASTVRRTVPLRVECGRSPETTMPGPLRTTKGISL